MKRRRGTAGCCAVTLGFLLAVRAAERPGVDQGGLRLVVTSDKSVYGVGEPIRLRLAWTNTGPVELRIPTWPGSQMGATAARYGGGEPTLLALAIYHNGQERVLYSGSIGSGADQGLRIEPGERRQTEFSIHDTYDMTRPGRYVVRVAYAGFDDDHAPPHAWKGLLVHPDFTFTVRGKGEP